jgi:hypothetical protein
MMIDDHDPSKPDFVPFCVKYCPRFAVAHDPSQRLCRPLLSLARYLSLVWYRKCFSGLFSPVHSRPSLFRFIYLFFSSIISFHIHIYIYVQQNPTLIVSVISIKVSAPPLLTLTHAHLVMFLLGAAHCSPFTGCVVCVRYRGTGVDSLESPSDPGTYMYISSFMQRAMLPPASLFIKSTPCRCALRRPCGRGRQPSVRYPPPILRCLPSGDVGSFQWWIG